MTTEALEVRLSGIEIRGLTTGAVNSFGISPSLAEFLVDQATNLLRGDPAWVGPLPPALTYRK